MVIQRSVQQFKQTYATKASYIYIYLSGLRKIDDVRSDRHVFFHSKHISTGTMYNWRRKPFAKLLNLTAKAKVQYEGKWAIGLYISTKQFVYNTVVITFLAKQLLPITCWCVVALGCCGSDHVICSRQRGAPLLSTSPQQDLGVTRWFLSSVGKLSPCILSD